MSFIHALDPMLEIARLRTTGHKPMSGFGEVVIGGSANNQDVWSGYGATAVQPEPVPAGYALWVESSAGADTSAGTGVQSVLIHYIDTAGAEQSVSASTAGVTPVDTGVSDCQFVQKFHATDVGTGLVAAGDIDCTNTSGGAVVSRILTAGNMSLSTMRMVPTGTTLYVCGWYASANGNANAPVTLRLRATSHELDSGAPASQPGTYLFKATLKTSREPVYVPLCPPVPVAAGATMKISAWTTGATEDAAGWRGVLVDD